MKKLAFGVLAAAALVALSPVPAQAVSFQYDQPIPVDSGIGGSATGILFLEVERAGLTEHAVLLCPEGVGHGKGEDACAQLTAAEGDFGALQPAGGMCTKELDPVVFRAIGFWDGEFVMFDEEFANYCTGVDATGGAVFDIGKP
jgi:hypothetical protein